MLFAEERWARGLGMDSVVRDYGWWLPAGAQLPVQTSCSEHTDARQYPRSSLNIFPFSRDSCRNKMCAASLTLKLLMTTTGRNHCQNCQQPFAVLLAGREYPSCCVLLCTFSGLCMAQLCNAQRGSPLHRYVHLRRRKSGPCRRHLWQNSNPSSCAESMHNSASCPGITVRLHQLLPCHSRRTCPRARAQPLRTMLANPVFVVFIGATYCRIFPVTKSYTHCPSRNKAARSGTCELLLQHSQRIAVY